MIFPYDIVEYDIDVICSHISYKTKTPFHLVRQKKQISYLNSYLTSPNISVTTLIIENSYIERSYSENYSEYYSRCFQPYAKVCSRIHFFKLASEIDSAGLEELLNNTKDNLFDSNGYKNLKKGYLGFMVIRPIPNTFLDKICLKPYDSLIDQENSFLIQRDYNSSLFGMPLSVRSIAFQEQDKVLSACATSALWSFCHASNHRKEKNIPSPGDITKLAKPAQLGYDRQFPNSGLSATMIQCFINKIGLEPEEIKINQSNNVFNSNLLKEYSYSFISSKIPLICGVSVYKKPKDTSDDVYIYEGDHAITILGYSLERGSIDITPIISKEDINLDAYAINELYVHDDRVGPFSKISFETKKVTIVDAKGQKNSSTSYLTSEINNTISSEIESFGKEILIPNILILGLYHKVRISYAVIKNTATEFKKFLFNFIKELNEKLSEEDHLIYDSWGWRISLYEVKDFKKEIINSNLINKIKYLTSHWPKYIWSIEVQDNNNIPLFNLCFDATDIPQGKIFLDILLFSGKMADLFQNFSKECEDLICNSTIGDSSRIDTNAYLWGVIDHFADVDQKEYSSILDAQYGELRLPRYFKDFEIKRDSLHGLDDYFEIYEEDKSLKLDENIHYLWLINEEGWLIIGEEKNISGKNKAGHVTLSKGRPSRIAGELQFCFIRKYWIVNSKSGRYSGNYLLKNSEEYLKNSIEKRFNVFIKNHTFINDRCGSAIEECKVSFCKIKK